MLELELREKKVERMLKSFFRQDGDYFASRMQAYGKKLAMHGKALCSEEEMSTGR